MNNIYKDLENILPGFGKTASYQQYDNIFRITVRLSIPKELGEAIKNHEFNKNATSNVVYNIRKHRNNLYQLCGQISLDCNVDVFTPSKIYYQIYDELKIIRNNLAKSYKQEIQRLQYESFIQHYK